MAGMEIVVGTYEQFTVCYRVEQMRKDPSKLYLKEVFAANLHTASVRSIASNGEYVATGGSDDRVCLLDIRDNTKETEFLHHDGTINTVAFSHDGSYLFTGSNDGSMSAINTAKLTVDKTWKAAHKSSVQSISIHPQGKMALSLGGDMVLKTWDLITGRALFTTALNKKSNYGSLTDVQWSPDGEHFALLGSKLVDVVSVETTRSVRTIQCDSKPTVMCWLSDDEIAVGLESGRLLLINIHQKDQQESLQIYESRLKALSSFGDYIATASSAGDVSLWHLHGTDFTQICAQHIGCRPICLTLLNSGQYQPGQERHEKQDGESSNKSLTNEPKEGVGRARTSTSTTISRVMQELAWVTVETEDPIQLAASKRTKRITNKRPLHAQKMAIGNVGSKRHSEFIEESINDAITLSTPFKKGKVKGSKRIIIKKKAKNKN